MKITLSTILLSIFSLAVFANDGIYLTRGGVIYPTKETNISIDREILSFKVHNKIAQVDIQFVFNNHENIERKILVGFQAPSAVGDISDVTRNTNQISNFQIQNEEHILTYQLKAAECEDCELKNLKQMQFTQSKSGVFVYLFEMTFKPGINKVNHSYTFPASSNIEINQFYKYILTTGSKWAGGTIRDLTIQIDMGDNKFFYVKDIFGQKADWSIIGCGKVVNKKIALYDKDSCRMVRVLTGKLQVNIKDFKPTKNIEFGVLSMDKQKFIDNSHLSLASASTNDELRLLRNTIYAQQGYTFKSKDLLDYFSKFDWYIPNPNITPDQINLTDSEKNFLNDIQNEEKK